MGRTWLIGIAVLVLSMAAQAAQGKVVVYDFERGMTDEFKLASSRGARSQYAPTAELEKNQGNTVLELGKYALMTLGDEEVMNFSIEADVRREYDMSGSHVGFQFRNGYRAYLRKPGRIELTGPNRAKGRGFSRNLSTFKPVRFKIVVAGPVVRFFINGKYEGQFDHLEMTSGPVALYQSGLKHNVYFDNVKLNTAIDPGQFLVCEPVTGEDMALVFDPSREIDLKFKVTNHAAESQEAELGIDLATFDDKPVFNTTSAPAPIEPGASKTIQVGLARIPEGYYRLMFLPTGKTVPLAVHARGTVTDDRIAMPKILTGVYWYYFAWELPAVWWNTYMHAACNDLRKHNFNTIICAIGMPTDSIEIAKQYGVRCFVRGEGRQGNVANPNVIGGFIGDEPHKGQEDRYIKEYTKVIEKYPDKVWTTCMIGDGGVEGCQSWWDTWMPLSKNNKVVRMFRWYGIKRSTIGIMRRYAMLPPLEEILRDMSRDDGPYYFIMPSFGGEGIQAYFGNPLPSQIRCMMHLAAAFEADGLFFWTYQTPFPGSVGFVDPATLLPLDGKWAAAGSTAGEILKNADLLSKCKWSGRYPFVDGPSLLEVFQLRRQDDPATYYYVVNKDTEHPVNARLFKLDTDHTLRDLFHDRDLQITKGTVQLMRPDLTAEGGIAHVSLMPGDGVLLKYAKPAETGEGIAEEKALPRVQYPKAVADAPADKIIWLADLEPIEMPVPGWIPALKFKGKKWYPDYNSNDLLLYSGPEDKGQLYEKSLWAHAETTIKYNIPDGAVTFAAAAGFGNKDEKSSAIFRVLVDGKEKYNSGVMELGTPVQPVVVDIAGGKVLELITEEAGDGLYGDYTFWGEARLIER